MIIPIRLKISNAYLIKGSKPILVDTGSPDEMPTILKALKAHHVEPADLSLIVHTHGHNDHCGNTYELKQLGQAATAIVNGGLKVLKSPFEYSPVRQFDLWRAWPC